MTGRKRRTGTKLSPALQRSEETKYARFWKCALQVNPEAYSRTYRGKDHGLAGQTFIDSLVRACKEQEVAVVGIADHGSVADVDAIRSGLSSNGIVVLPGFEICTTERIHWVCLFPEETTRELLERYLGRLGLMDPTDGIRPSSLGGLELLATIAELGGLCYAAHVAADKGILTQRAHHLWTDRRLVAAQIAASPDDLQQGLRAIAANVDPTYKRERPIALINAKDVAAPVDLADPRATCFIKMTVPSFHSLAVAFKDSQSRVRRIDQLVDVSPSHLVRIRITGGYLDGLDVMPSPQLNAVIGGRGAGKSTLLECIRFCLGHEPKGSEARKLSRSILEENLGDSGALVELTVQSAHQSGAQFLVKRAWGGRPEVCDETGTKSQLTVDDLIPGVEVYGQNEVIDIARDSNALVLVLDRFLPSRADYERSIRSVERKLTTNAEALCTVWDELAETQSQVDRLPALEEQLRQLDAKGIGDKLKLSPLLARERQVPPEVRKALAGIAEAIDASLTELPSETLLDEYGSEAVHHASHVASIRVQYLKLLREAKKRLNAVGSLASTQSAAIEKLLDELEAARGSAARKLEREFTALPAVGGKSGSEVGKAFQKLQSQVAAIRPAEQRLKRLVDRQIQLKISRTKLLKELTDTTVARSEALEGAVKKLNRTLKGNLRLKVQRGADRGELKALLGQLRGIGEKSLEWIDSAAEFDLSKFVTACRSGAAALSNLNWGITGARADAIAAVSAPDLLRIEALQLPDRVHLELNVSHTGEDYRSLEKLSTGQQCTAILHLILLDNCDPLIMDQPEDNLDNAFIAERIVQQVRSAKASRQFLFATHNANIPVFGDAEWIGVFEAGGGRGGIPLENQGSIDTARVREFAARILDGGKEAFLQRQHQYGY